MGDSVSAQPSAQPSVLDRLLAWSQGQRAQSAAQAQALEQAQAAYNAQTPAGDTLLRFMASPKGQASGQQAIATALGMGGGTTPIVGPNIAGIAVADGLRGAGALDGIGYQPPRAAPEPTVIPSGPTIKLPDQTEVQGVPYQPSIVPDASVVWHGTRHTFEPVEGNPFGAFSNDAIGSGEGAQVYGVGHYVAQNPGIASYYRTAGESSDPVVGLKDEAGNPLFEMTKFGKATVGSDANLSNAQYHALNTVAQLHGDVEQAIKVLSSPGAKNYSDVKEFLENNRGNIYYKPNSSGTYGNLYQVEMQADPDKMLDWDKNLADQPPAVQSALSQVPKAVPGFKLGLPDGWGTGQNMLEALQDHYNLVQGNYKDKAAAMASQTLQDLGLHGIRYRDAASRGQGPGTQNFVVFDPSHLRIVGKNGVRYVPEAVDHDPFAEPQE